MAGAILAVGLLLGGCRSSSGAAAPPAAGAGDPLAGVEATVDAVDRAISADAAAPDGTDPRPSR